MLGAQRLTTPAPHPVLPMPISMPRISLSATHNKGSAGVAGAGAEQSSSSASRWTLDYAARVLREPRGRKSGGGWGMENPRWPTRAEGEKRFRSAMRNPYAAMQSVP